MEHPQSAPQAGSKPVGVTPQMQKTVLVVEDNELNMKLFNDLLEAHGYRVVQTRDGLSALDMARKQSTLDWFDKDFTVVAGPLGDVWLEAGRDVAAPHQRRRSASLASPLRLSRYRRR